MSLFHDVASLDNIRVNTNVRRKQYYTSCKVVKSVGDNYESLTTSNIGVAYLHNLHHCTLFDKQGQVSTPQFQSQVSSRCLQFSHHGILFQTKAIQHMFELDG